MQKTWLATAAVALILALPTAGNALSLSVSGSVSASGGATAGNGGAGVSGSDDATASITAAGNGSADAGSADAAANVDESSVIAAFADDQASLDAIANLRADSKVEVVRIAPIVSADATAFTQALTTNSDATAKLQAAITANADLNAQLGQNSVDVATIVAADVDAEGTLVLYSNS